MAKVELIKEQLIKEQPYCSLILTKSEAEVLLVVCGSIIGSFKGPRRKTTDIFNALQILRLDVTHTEHPRQDMVFGSDFVQTLNQSSSNHCD